MRRRRFLRDSAIAATGLPLASCDCGGRQTRHDPTPPAQANGHSEDHLVLVSTWSWGETVCDRGAEKFRETGSLLDAIQAGVMAVESDPEVLTVGAGGYPNEAGVVQLDAMMMKGSTLEAGAVGALEEIENPIAVARKVMEHTRHILLVGAGAQAFAVEEGFERHDIRGEAAQARYREWVEETGGRSPMRLDAEENHDTVGALGVDASGEVVAGVSTSGLAFKLPGRVGDSPLVGAGGYADAEVGAACATGVGEEVIRTCGSFAIVEAMRNGVAPQQAIEGVLRRLVRRRGGALAEAQVAYLAIGRDGSVGAAALKPGFEYFMRRGGRTERVEVTPLA